MIGTALPKLLVLSIFAQIVMWISLLLNIIILRPIIGFVYLTFFPGFIILNILRYREMTPVDILLFSSGLSLFFLMFLGLAVNEILPLFGITEPLSTFPLLTTVSIATFALSCVAVIKRKQERLFVLPTGQGIIANPATPLLASLPVLSILCTLVMKGTNNNIPLLLVLTFVAALIALSALGMVPAPLYPLLIVSIATALLFQTSLASNYLSGWDIHLEYQLAEITRIRSYWDPAAILSASGPVFSGSWTQYGKFDSMLSITILPVVYVRILGIETLPVYTIIYPILFSLVPLALYRLYCAIFDERVALLSVLFFISFFVFYGNMLYLARQMIAELFFVLIFLLALDKKTNTSIGQEDKYKSVMLFILSAALIASHYSVAFICALYVLAIALVSIFSRRSRILEINMVYLGLFLVMAFAWYLFISSMSPLMVLSRNLAAVGSHIVTDMFNLSTRGQAPSQLITLGPASWQRRISRIIFLATIAFIGIGYVKSIFSLKNARFSAPYFVVSSVSIVLLLATVLLPSFAAALNTGRFYHIALFFAAPFCILGADFLLSRASTIVHSLFATGSRRRSHVYVSYRAVLLALLLVLYFLSQVGYLYEVTGDVPISVSLTVDKSRLLLPGGDIGSYDAFSFGQDVFGARWLSRYMASMQNVSVYGDNWSYAGVLTSQGMLNWGHMEIFFIGMRFPTGTYIFLRRLNVINGLIEHYGQVTNITELSRPRNMTDKIYSNGGTEVYYCNLQSYCTEDPALSPPHQPSSGISTSSAPEVNPLTLFVLIRRFRHVA